MPRRARSPLHNYERRRQFRTSNRAVVAAALADLDYNVTVVDPYDGSGGGPTAYEQFVQSYPRVRIIQEEFRPGLAELEYQTFDAIYSLNMFPNQHCEHYSMLSRGI